MRDILLIGAGKIGETIADMLSMAGDYRVTVADRAMPQLSRLKGGRNLQTLALDVDDSAALAKALTGRYAVLSAAPYSVTGRIATQARQAGVHYLDLTEDVASTRLVKTLAEDATTAFIPQCGLAPGFISIVARDLAARIRPPGQRAHAGRALCRNIRRTP